VCRRSFFENYVPEYIENYLVFGLARFRANKIQVKIPVHFHEHHPIYIAGSFVGCGDMDMHEMVRDDPHLAGRIVRSYVGHHDVPVGELSGLIATVPQSLGHIGQNIPVPEVCSLAKTQNPRAREEDQVAHRRTTARHRPLCQKSIDARR
jgi:hypothetical protein